MNACHLRTAICLASDQNYIDYTYVTVLSIAEHASKDSHYEVVILSTGVLEYKKQIFYGLNSDNFSVRFVDMEEYIDRTKMSDFFISRHISMATYFRYFIPEIFKDYERVLYMDGDVIALQDVAEIFSFDMTGRILGVVVEWDNDLFPDWRKNYHIEYLGIDWNEYFCAGILLYNIPECLAENLQKKCFETQERLVNPPLHDQDVLNAVTFGRNLLLPTRWHFMTWIYTNNIKHNNLKEQSPERYADYMAASHNPALLHFGGKIKPWNKPALPFADLWWQVARQTPFYERFLSEIHHSQINTVAHTLKKHCTALSETQSHTLAQIRKHEELMRLELLRATVLSAKRRSLKYRHALYRLLSKVTGGRLRKKFLTKRQEIKAQLDFLKRCAR